MEQYSHFKFRQLITSISGISEKFQTHTIYFRKKDYF